MAPFISFLHPSYPEFLIRLKSEASVTKLEQMKLQYPRYSRLVLKTVLIFSVLFLLAIPAFLWIAAKGRQPPGPANRMALALFLLLVQYANIYRLLQKPIEFKPWKSPLEGAIFGVTGLATLGVLINMLVQRWHDPRYLLR